MKLSEIRYQGPEEVKEILAALSTEQIGKMLLELTKSFDDNVIPLHEYMTIRGWMNEELVQRVLAASGD